MTTRVISRHLFRRTARAQERALERRQWDRIELAVDLGQEDVVTELRRTSYRVARRRGGFRWCVEEVTR